MPYKIISICDRCGRTDEMVASTLDDIGQIAAQWMVQALLAREAGFPKGKAMTIRCPKCTEDDPIPEDSVRIDGFGNVKKGQRPS